eukprot:gene2241-1402_t
MERTMLFTPGPLMTSDTVKQAMLMDYGSRDQIFMDAVSFVRQKILQLAGVPPAEWACVLQPGAGTMGIEAAMGTLTPAGGTYVLVNTGKYSERQVAIAQRFGLKLVQLMVGEGKDINMLKLEGLLKTQANVACVGYVHHETSTGMVYPGHKIYALVKRTHPEATVIADCMSSFGGIPFNVATCCDALVTSPNKCFHSVPGVAIVVARRALILKGKGRCPSESLDLYPQLLSLEKTGQFRNTPPVQVVMALQQALKEYEADGGLEGRVKQYKAKFDLMIRSVLEMGFTLFLGNVRRPGMAHIVVCVNMPSDPRFDFKKFYTTLNKNGFVIYPGKASHANTFRFAVIGHTSLDDVQRLMDCSSMTLKQMGIDRLIGAAAKL